MNENVPNTETEQSLSPSQDSGQSVESQTQAPGDTPTIPDLGTMEKFRFEGRELTPDELRRSMLMQADYSKKTASIAEERRQQERFEKAWEADQDALVNDPSLLDKFKQIYPKSYHRLADQLVQYARAQNNKPPERQENQPEWAQKLSMVEQKFARFEKAQFEAEVSKINSELDTKLKSLGDKYPHADVEAALARAQVYHNQGNDLNDRAWEEIFKQLHAKSESRFKEYQTKLATAQKTANQKGRDTASGGGIPGSAPDMPKTIKEASEYIRSRI